MIKGEIPMNLKLFGHPAAGAEGGTPPAATPAGTPAPAAAPTPAAQGVAVDYDKIQTMLDGTLAAKEETALKAYFKQQGLSQEEAEQAIGTYKQQRAAAQPDVGALQSQAATAQAEAQKAKLDSAATMAAVSLGLDAKTIPYVIKLAELGTAVGADGAIDAEAVKAAINQVLEDVPNLKPQLSQSSGFVQVGAGATGSTSAQDAELDKIFGIKK